MSSQVYRYKEVEIENFLLFKGNDNKISFPENKLILALNGENMAGKTSLLKFFYWMLFSDNNLTSSFNIIKELLPTKKPPTDPLSYLNHLEKEEDVDQCQVGGKLLLEIKSDKSKRNGEYEISKYIIFNKNSSGEFTPKEFKIQIIDPNYLTLSRTEIEDFFADIRNDFPKEIRNFIFIPSETLGDLFTEKFYSQIREFSIHRSELPFLDKIYDLIDMFVMLCDYFIKQEENKTGQLKIINKDIETLESEIQKKQEKIVEVTTLKDGLENEVHQIDEDIQTLFKNKETSNKWQAINNKRINLEKQLERKSNELSKFLKGNAVKIYLFNEMCEIQKDLELKEDFPHFFDKNIALTIIHDIKNDKLKECPICGIPIKKLEASTNLDEYINGLIDKEGADTEVAIKFKTKLKNEIKKISEVIDELKKLHEEREAIKKELADAEVNEKSLSSQLTDEEKSEDYSKTYETKVKQKRIKEQLIRTKTTAIHRIDLEIEKKNQAKKTKDSEKEQINTKREKISTEEGKWKEVKNTFVRVKKVLTSLIIPEYEETIKNRVLENTKEVCRYIFDIDYESFEIKINEVPISGAGKKSGWMIEFDEDLYDKSNGQEIILIISYIISILKTLDIEIPLFLDGPFSVLDDPFSARLADILSKLGEKQQFIITLLNKILTDEVKLNLKEDMCNKYSVISEVKRFKSRIEKLERWD